VSNMSTEWVTFPKSIERMKTQGVAFPRKRDQKQGSQRTVDFLPSTDLPRPTSAALVDLRPVGDTPKRAKRQDEPRVAMPVGGSMPGALAREIGAVLRLARRARGLTLRNVSSLSSGTFKPSSLASYERGERTLSVERFLLLADLYDIPPARLIAEISRRAEGRPPIVVDVRTVDAIGGVEGAVLAEFVHEVIALRRQPASEDISLRDGDLEVLATASGRRAEQFVEAVERALRGP
jgi:transcriptional regulator with XRE-family HTH domain